MKLVSFALEDSDISGIFNDERDWRRLTESGACDVVKHNLWLNAASYNRSRKAFPIHDLNTC